MTIQSRVPASEYFALPGVSITRLKELKRSPQHYKYLLANPKESNALTLGTATHVAVLEPERYGNDYAIWEQRQPNGNLRPRNGNTWEAFKSANEDKTIITADEHALSMTMQKAVRANTDAMRYLETGDPEVTMQWDIEPFQCKGRLDWLTTVDGWPVLVGLKTARDCRHFIFGSAAAKLGYHLQWAYYYDAYKQITGREARVVEIVVESAPPHAVAVYSISDDILWQGRDEYLALLKLLGECKDKNEWPGPEVGEQVLTLPSWVYEVQDDLTDIGLEM